MVFDKNFVLLVFSIFSLFVVVLYKLNGFLLVYRACSHLASAISATLAYMCEYWSCALQSKLSRPPEISRCRAFTWIIVVPVNWVTCVVQARYLGPRVIPVSCERTSFQNRETRANRDISGAREIPAPEISRLMWTGSNEAHCCYAVLINNLILFYVNLFLFFHIFQLWFLRRQQS